ncbi:MAG: ArsC/Spx/MgsR family protein [Pseudomonadota bacterium]
MIQIFHNARCSKSRAALLLAEQAADRLDEALCIRDYLSQPLSISELNLLLEQLAVPAHMILREDDARQLCPAILPQRDHTMAVLQAIAQEPRLLQRPIVVRNGRAAIGRPPEAVLPLFD